MGRKQGNVKCWRWALPDGEPPGTGTGDGAAAGTLACPVDIYTLHNKSVSGARTQRPGAGQRPLAVHVFPCLVGDVAAVGCKWTHRDSACTQARPVDVVADQLFTAV